MTMYLEIRCEIRVINSCLREVVVHILGWVYATEEATIEERELFSKVLWQDLAFKDV